VALDWYSGTPPYTITPLDGIKAIAGAVKVNYAANNGRRCRGECGQTIGRGDCVRRQSSHLRRGVAKCPTPSDGKEAMDRKWIDLEQEALVKAGVRGHPKPWWCWFPVFPSPSTGPSRTCPILHITHNAQEEGSAIAEVLSATTTRAAGSCRRFRARSIRFLPR